MGADKALVEGAYRAAMAKVPGDYSKFYYAEAQAGVDATKSIIKSGLGALDTVMAKHEELKLAAEADKKRDDEQWNKFLEVCDAMERKFGSYERGGKEESLNEDIYNLYLQTSMDLKERFKMVNTTGANDTPENRRERNRIYGELQGSVNELKTFGGNIINISKLANNDKLSKEGIGSKKAYEWGEISNQDSDWSNVTVGREDGKGLFFEVDTATYENPVTGKVGGWGKVKIYGNEVNERYNIPKATGQESWFVAKNGWFSDRVKKEGKKSEITEQGYLDLKDAIGTNMLTNDRAIADIGNRRIDGMPDTVRGIFTSDPKLLTATYASFGIKLARQVGNKDDVITEEDFSEDNPLLAEDIKKIADAVFNIDDDNYVRSTSKDVISEILALTTKKRHDDLVDDIPEDPSKTPSSNTSQTFSKSGNYFIPTGTNSQGNPAAPRNVPVTAVNPTIEALDSNKDYAAISVPFNNDYKAHRRVKGQYQMMDSNGDWIDLPNANQVAMNLSIDHLLTSSSGVTLPGVKKELGSKENPITRKRKKGETLNEGEYWKNSYNNQVYIVKNGKWVEVSE